MYLSINMGLFAWDDGDDGYDYSQLADNFKLLDEHNHTAGKGVQIPSDGIQDNAIVSSKIADANIVTAKIANNAVTLSKMADNSVGSDELVSNSVTTDKIADASVTGAKLAPGTVDLGDIKMTLVQPPAGSPWEILDGRAWSTVPNDLGLTTGNMPNLLGAYPIGASTLTTGPGPTQAPAVGQSVGANVRDLTHGHSGTPHSHPHAHTVPHGHAVSSHVHGISPDGDHNHGMHSRQNTHEQAGDLLQSLYIAGFNQGQPDQTAPLTGGHAHSGTTLANTASTSVDSPGTTVDATIASTNVDAVNPNSSNDYRPTSVGVYFIAKVRIQ